LASRLVVVVIDFVVGMVAVVEALVVVGDADLVVVREVDLVVVGEVDLLVLDVVFVVFGVALVRLTMRAAQVMG
jgi:hypothetical protein